MVRFVASQAVSLKDPIRTLASYQGTDLLVHSKNAFRCTGNAWNRVKSYCLAGEHVCAILSDRLETHCTSVETLETFTVDENTVVHGVDFVRGGLARFAHESDMFIDLLHKSGVVRFDHTVNGVRKSRSVVLNPELNNELTVSSLPNSADVLVLNADIWNVLPPHVLSERCRTLVIVYGEARRDLTYNMTVLNATSLGFSDFNKWYDDIYHFVQAWMETKQTLV